MVDDNEVSRDRVQKLIAVADFELRSFGRLSNETDQPQITQIFLMESA